ncbi:MAG TPA: histidine phosphatase family protein [Pseudonocardiaceae bacterium]|nr:histidine phosphatase family protein [Pseudonocardiaceae bacterium]
MTVPPSAEYRQPRFTQPPGATVLLVVRHGESAPARPGAPFPLVEGRGDPELAPDGKDQAERIGARLATRGVAAIYVSGLQRTAQTAAPLATRIGLPPEVVTDLMEVGLGEWEGGLFRQHVAERHPLALRMLAEERWDVIPGAESLDDLRARVRRGIDRIAAAHVDQRVAVFTHGGVIGTIVSMATGSRPFAFNHAENGSLTELVVMPDRWAVRTFNDTSHL